MSLQHQQQEHLQQQHDMDANTRGKVRVLDLFCGVGGFSRALREVARTVAYCEAAPACWGVLCANMDDGLLEPGLVFDNVAKLTGAQLEALAPELITAGFPCQDISSAGAGKGLDGERSGLFFHIPRLVKETPSIKHVLLENSSNIKKLGLERVLEELRAAGLVHIAYGYFSASDVGALHRRCRWVCLASKAPHELPLFTPEQFEASVQHAWMQEPVERLVPRVPERAPTYEKRRCGLLGNAVVPQFIAYTYDCLLRALLDVPALDINDNTNNTKRRDVIVDCERTVHFPTLAHNSVEMELVAGDGRVLDAKTHFNTPLHNVFAWYQTPNPGSRSLRTPGNCIFYDRNTRTPGDLAPNASARGQFYNVNSEFVEWLMGYPVGWTRGYTYALDQGLARRPWSAHAHHAQEDANGSEEMMVEH